jgi:hypothetical protein
VLKSTLIDDEYNKQRNDGTDIIKEKKKEVYLIL